jgi:hypothetical protein
MRRSDVETAAILALMLHRSGKSRGRITKRTFELASGRERVHPSFVERVRGCLEELDVVMLENSRGGYALISAVALDGAPIISLSSVRDAIRSVKQGNGLSGIWEELGFSSDEPDIDEDD